MTSSEFMTEDLTHQIQNLIQRSLSYPSGDNSQPFFFTKRKNQNKVKVSHDKNRAQHPLNAHHVASLIAFGHFLEILRIESIVAGLQVEVSLDPSLPQGLTWAELHFQKIKTSLSESPASSPSSLSSASLTSPSLSPDQLSQNDIFLHQNLKKRATDRRPFFSQPLSEAHQQELFQLVEPPLQLHFITPPPPDWRTFLLELEQQAWKWPELAQATFKWIKFGSVHTDDSVHCCCHHDHPHHHNDHHDGMPWQNLGIPQWMTPSLFLFKKFPWFYQLASQWGATYFNKQILLKQISDSCLLGFWQLEDPTPENLISLGRSNLRVWTWLTGHGYGYQPLTLGSLPSYLLHHKNLPETWPHPLIQLLKKSHSILKHTLPSPHLIIWSFRTGGSSPLPEELRTQRLDLKQVWQDGD